MPDPDQRVAAGRALFLKVLGDDVARLARDARDAVEPTLVAGEKVKATMPDGQVLGTVQLTEAPESVTITDPAALLAFVKRTRPDEVVTREEIRPAFLAHLRAMAREQITEDTHGGLVVDGSGEIVPGLALDLGTPRYVPTVTTSGRAAVRAALAALLGGHTLREVLELTPRETQR
jgi:hypothetical protein